ncbi:MAG: ThuA domain-containing protein [Bryobacteraceae bacterium]
MIWAFFLLALPHTEQVAPGVWASGLADKLGSANIAWVAKGGEVALVHPAPAGISDSDLRTEVARISGKKVRAGSLVEAGEPHFLRESGVLFAGRWVVNGPRANLAGRDTAQWIAKLREFEKLGAKRVVPGQGSWGGAPMLTRQRVFLEEVRRQVGYAISMGRPLAAIQQEVLLPATYYTWMPYDLPSKEDIAHVYGEMTAPQAPFRGAAIRHPAALVLIADRFHEPEHLEAGLRPAIEAVGVTPYFTVDVTALNAENLAKVDLLVVLRDGMLWPEGGDKPYKIWMTPEQEKAVVDFVEGGKAFLNLHNSMGLYPENGPYLNLVGGKYIGHGPLERFRVEVVDKAHPITQGVSDWSAADEQHTPPHQDKVKLLLRNRSDEGQTAAAGWWYEPGRGRLCHLASGHTRDALEHPMYQRLLRNAVEWCLRKR